MARKKTDDDFSHLMGWIPPEKRTDEMLEADALARTRMPKFAILGPSGPLPDRVMLTEMWKHEDVVASLGYAFPGIHQLTGSCFPAGTPVRMKSGEEKPIEEIKVGDEVLTHEGRYRPVVECMNRKYTGELHKLHVAGFAFPLEMTADHQVAVVSTPQEWRWDHQDIQWRRADELNEGDRVIIGYSRESSSPKTIDVAELLGDRAIVLDDLMDEGKAPVSNVGMAQYVVRKSGVDWRGKIKLVRGRTENAIVRHIPIGPSLGRLMGLYLAEGGCHEGRVVFTYALDEQNLVGETLALVRGLFGVEGDSINSDAKPSVTTVRFDNSTLAAAFKALVPGDVYSKRVPGVVFHADADTKLAVLLGWMAGDGYAADHNKGIRIQGVTVSKGLARDMTTLALSCGIRASCSRRKGRGASKPAYDVYLSGKKVLAHYPAMLEASKYRRPYDTDSNEVRQGYARKITKIETHPVENMKVYDFEVKEDHSFVAGGLTVHNCVGAGGANVEFSTLCAEVLVAKQPHRIILPFWPLTYGRGRMRAGIKGKGDGSFGTAQAEAARLDGWIDSGADGLPAFKQDQGLVLTARIETDWSDGAAISEKWLAQARPNVIGTTAVQDSADGVKAGLQNYYAHTCAVSHYCNPKNAKVKEGMVVGQFDTSGGHQTSIQGYKLHPVLGDMFWYQNQWGDVYPQDPETGRRDGCWITKQSMQWACAQREVIAYSGLTGFMTRTWDWIFRN